MCGQQEAPSSARRREWDGCGYFRLEDSLFASMHLMSFKNQLFCFYFAHTAARMSYRCV